MDIRLDEIGKRYRYEWVFKKVNYRFENGRTYALLGPNGSGKSTFLKILIGHLSPTKGKITFSHQDKVIKPDLVYQHLGLAAPYMELLEEFTLEEAITFHAKFKSLQRRPHYRRPHPIIISGIFSRQTHPLFLQRHETKTQTRPGALFRHPPFSLTNPPPILTVKASPGTNH
ncbi:MAG: ATP-binding cassette domain-containing protein [Saprospiraceae bacterium]